jgi:hypothetical protein
VRILLDESLPHELAFLLGSHDVTTVRDRGWAGKRNGSLLRLAAAEFEAFVTTDQGIPHQQNLSRFEIRIVVIAAGRNRMDQIRPLIGRILEAIETARPGVAMWVRS